MSQSHKRIVLFLLILSFIPYLYVSFYANPGADDFMYGHLGKKGDFINSLLYQYNFWSGRYTSNIFVLIGPLTFHSFTFYKIVPIAIILLTVFSFSYFIRSSVGRSITLPDNYIISVSLCLLYLYQMPTIAEGIYWYTGSVTYQLGNIFAITYLSLLFSYYKKKFIFSNRILHLISITFMAFFTIGFNEVLMVIMVLFSVIFSGISYYKKLPHKGLSIYLLIITLIFAAIIVFAPGNYVRESFYPNKHQFFISLFYSSAQTARFFLIWISSAPLFIMSVVFYYLNKKLSQSIPIFSASFYLKPTSSSFLLFFVIFISVFPAYWATGILGQHRTLNVAYYFFIILWFVNLNVWFNRFKENLNMVQPIKLKGLYFLLIISIGCFLFAKNGNDSSRDLLSGNAKSYDLQMQERYKIVKEAKDTIFFNPIRNPPKSFHVYDITNDHESWYNTCWALYFECEGKPVIKK